MTGVVYIFVVLSIVVFIATRMIWRRKTYASVLGPYLEQHGYELVSIKIPRFYKTGPFPKIAFRLGAVHTTVLGANTTHFEYRIVTFKDREGGKSTRWVQLLLNSSGTQDIVWEPDTDELPNYTGLPK